MSQVNTLLIVALHSFVIYAALIIGLRVLSRRQLGQITVIDLLIILFLGSAVETALVNKNTTLQAGIVSASVLIITNRMITLLARKSKWFRHIVCGGPVLLVKNGRIIEETLKRIGMTTAELEAALRQREVASIEEVRFGVLEEDGTVNVIRSPTTDTKSHRPLQKSK